MFEELGSEASDDELSIHIDAHAEFGVTCKAEAGPNSTTTMARLDRAFFDGLLAWMVEKALGNPKAILTFLEEFQPQPCR